ncbi:Nramp family divalent metal transporter [Lunatimonas sp.]|uniref:Nramp family divalent metal transporter n=1 Tax=Lunatimonas sp. TaxID=2060141 RepID=UPI00263B1DAC|nr:Nramp family divalent metal transporter [Lunatimonas sp.]
MKEPSSLPSKHPGSFRRWWKSLGPGIITAALVFGPGSLTITSKLGAVFSYNLLWVLVVTTVLMMTFTGMGARIGLVTNQSLLATFRQRWGKWAALLAGFGIFLVTASFQAGNTIGAGLAFAESFGTSTVPWILFISLAAISLLFTRSFYKILEKVMVTMVGIMLISFLFTVVISKPDWVRILQSLVPSVPEGSLLLVIALVASTFSIGGAFYQSYLVQERGWKTSSATQAKKEAFTGILVLGLISGMILVSAATILFPQGIQVNSASDMGKALEPLYGNLATHIFMLGLFGASFSSLVGNATIGGTLFADALGLGRDLNSKPVKILISLVIVLGATVALVFGRLPLELIVFAQGVTIFVVPFIGIGMFLIAGDTKLMGALANSRRTRVLGVVGILVLLVLAGTNFKSLFLS